jgi:hypothetical protein
MGSVTVLPRKAKSITPWWEEGRGGFVCGWRARGEIGQVLGLKGIGQRAGQVRGTWSPFAASPEHVGVRRVRARTPVGARRPLAGSLTRNSTSSETAN